MAVIASLDPKVRARMIELMVLSHHDPWGGNMHPSQGQIEAWLENQSDDTVQAEFIASGITYREKPLKVAYTIVIEPGSALETELLAACNGNRNFAFDLFKERVYNALGNAAAQVGGPGCAVVEHRAHAYEEEYVSCK